MSRTFFNCVAALVLLFAFTLAPCLRAAGPLSFQHGGRGIAEAGAFTARSALPSGMAYNPATIAGLQGLQIEAGIDYEAPRDDFSLNGTSYAAHHVIYFTPAVYVSWHLPADRYPFVLGLSIDSAAWHIENWDPALFPARSLTRRQELTIFDLHPVVAYPLNDHWRIGGGLHYYRGGLEEGNNFLTESQGTYATYPVEVARLAQATVDGVGADLGVQYVAAAWGWGATYVTGATLSADGRVTYAPRDVPDAPGVEEDLAARFAKGHTHQSFDLPWQTRMGAWYAVARSMRLELDLDYAGWSQVDQTTITYRPNPAAASSQEVRPRHWDDTLSVRLGMEKDLSAHWILAAGVGFEPSPVPREYLEPGFSRGDAIVYAAGFSYSYGDIAFNLGYSIHDYQHRSALGQDSTQPGLEGSYSARNQVFGFSAAWHW